MKSDPIIKGNTGDSLVLVGNPTPKRDNEGNWELPLRYYCKLENFKTLLPANKTKLPEPWQTQFPDLILSEVEGEIQQNGLLIYFDLIYKAPEKVDNSFNKRLKEGPQYSITGVSREKPIDVDPTLSLSEKAMAKAEGQKSNLVFSVAFTKTELLNSFALTEANILSGINARTAPEDVSGISEPLNWLKTSFSIKNAPGDKWEKSQTWEYDASQWKGLILVGGGNG